MHPRHHPTRVVIAAAREANARFLAASPPSPPPPETTGAIYDSATSDVSYTTPAIRIGSTVYMPDEELAVEVNASHARIRQELVTERRGLSAMGDPDADYKAYKIVSDRERSKPPLEQAPYSVRFALDYRRSQATGQANTVKIFVQAHRDGRPPQERIPVWFVNLKGGLAKDFYFAD